MVKSVIKEILIILLLLVVIILALGIIFYNYMPSNKTVPNIEEYTASEEVKTALNEKITEEEKVLVTYELTSSDLKNYERSKDYKKGKVNPFSTYDTTPKTEDENNVTNAGTANVGTSNASESTTNTGTNTFYGNTGTK